MVKLKRNIDVKEGKTLFKKVAIATFAIAMLSACGTTTGPGNKEDVNDQIEQQNYRGNDNQWDNRNGDNNLNRKQLNDDRTPMNNDRAPLNDNNTPLNNDRAPSNDTNNLGPNNENINDRNMVR